MQFDHPEYVHLIWVFILMWLFVFFMQRIKKNKNTETLGRLASTHFYKNYSRSKVVYKFVLKCLAWVFLILAAMGPRWGLKMEEVRKQKGLDIMICADVSRSMLAEDVPPNRLERIKLDIQDMISVLQSDRVGLIAFAGAAVAVCPLTQDLNYFNDSLKSLSSRSAPRGGTFVGDAIRKALKSFDKSEGRTKIIFVITDGEDQDSLPLEAARDAASKEVKIFTVGMGDPDIGTPIPIMENGVKKYLQHEGKTVMSRMNGVDLKKIAEITQGAYIPAGTSLLKLDEIYKKYMLPLERKEENKDKVSLLKPRFQWFIMGAIVLLIMDILMGTKKIRETKV